MKCYSRLGMVFSFVLVLAVGCSQDKSNPAPQVDGSKYLLSREPEGAKGVTRAREEAKNDDEVVVVGRIGGEENPWIDGLAVFTIVDPSFKSCNEVGDDGCKKPWDFC